MPKTTPHKAPRKKKIEAPAEENPQLESTLEEIYQEDDGTIPDMKNFERRGSRAGLVFTFFAILFLAAAGGAAWLGYFIFNPSQKFSEKQVVVTIDAPATVISGVEEDYVVTLKNDGELPLANSDISIKTPTGFTITSASPAATTNRNEHWVIGTLSAHESKKIELKGIYVSPKGTHDTIRLLVDFRPSNFNADFQKVVNQDITIADEALALSITKKEGDKTDDLVVKYKNTTDQPIVNGQVVVTLGDGFTVSKSVPAAKQQSSTATLAVPQLDAHAEQTLTLTGATATTTTATPSASFQIPVGGNFLEIAHAGFGTAPAPTTETGVTLKDNNGGSSTQLTAGAAADLAITFTNNSGKSLDNLTVVLSGDAPSVKNKSILDYSQLSTEGDPDVVGKQINPDRRAATITWAPDKTDVLKSVANGQTITLHVHLAARALTAGEDAPKQTTAAFTATVKNSTINVSSGQYKMTFTGYAPAPAEPTTATTTPAH